MSFRSDLKTFSGVTGLSAICVGLTAIGCGGAGGNGSVSAVGVHSETLGQAQVSFTGSPKAPSTSSSGSVSSIAQAGATYTSLALNPTPNLASTYLVFSRGGINGTQGTSLIYTSPINGSTSPTPLYTGYLLGFYPTCSQTGLIAFDVGGTQHNGFIQFSLPDGTLTRYLYPATTGGYIPSISPDGTTVIYSNQTNTLTSVNSVGGNLKTIYTAPTGSTLAQSPVVWSPDSKKVAFAVYTGSASKIYILTLATGTTSQLSVTGYAGNQLVPNSFSPDGNTIACTDYQLGNVVLISAYGQVSELTPSSIIDSLPAISPDGKKIAFYRSVTNQTHGIYVSDFNGENPQLVVADPSNGGTTGPVTGLVWSPYNQRQTFVGTGGSLSTAASGFLLSQVGSQFGSLLTFTAKTPSLATAMPPNGAQPGAPLIYTLGADSITNISFTNAYYGGSTVINPTGITSVVVSVDSTTGQVDLVAPAIALSRSNALGTKGGTSYTGQFSAIYDGAGKNLAPSGATSIQIDPRTGKLISCR